MAILKSNPIEGVLANITIYEYTNDVTGDVLMRQLIAHEGYAIYDKTQDNGVDENGNPYPPTYHYMFSLPATSPLSNFEAVLIDETMEVVGDRPEQPETEVM